MPQIVPIKELRDTTKISEMCHATSEPIYITRNGYGDLIVQSIEAYESQMFRQRMYDEIMKGAAQADYNEMLDGNKAIVALGEKYGRKV